MRRRRAGLCDQAVVRAQPADHSVSMPSMSGWSLRQLDLEDLVEEIKRIGFYALDVGLVFATPAFGELWTSRQHRFYALDVGLVFATRLRATVSTSTASTF